MTATDRPILGPTGARMASGGEVSHTVTVGGALIGTVYDARPWKGSQFGARRWCAVWREEQDRAVRWRREGFLTRTAAVTALVAVRDEGEK